MWDKFRTSSEDKENAGIISGPKLIETTYDEGRLSTLPTVDQARKASYAKDAPGLSPFPFEKQDNMPTAGRLSSESPAQSRTIPHTGPDVQFSFNHDTAAPPPLFAGKPMPQRLSQTFSTLMASNPETLGLGINERPVSEISEYDSAPEVSTAVRVSRVPLGDRSAQTITTKSTLREPWRGASGASERLTPIEATPAAASIAGSDQSKGYFHPRIPESLTSGSPDATDRTVERAGFAPGASTGTSNQTSSGLAVPETRTWRSASTGAAAPPPAIRVDTPAVFNLKKEHNSPKSVTRYDWSMGKAVDRPRTPESVSSGTWPSSRLSESHSNPTMRATSMGQSAVLRSAARAPSLAPIPQASILDRKRPIPRDRDHLVEETAADSRAKAEAASRDITPPPSESGDIQASTGAPEPLDPDGQQTPRAHSSLSKSPSSETRTPSPASIHMPKLRSREPPRDRTAVLQNELDNLTSRRRTLERLIRNITDFAPANPLVRDLATRREDADRVRAVERELAETRRREHDVGLKLVRAWQKRDFDDGKQFFVRRVATK